MAGRWLAGCFVGYRRTMKDAQETKKRKCNIGAHDIISGSFGSQPNFLETLCVVDQEARSGSYTLLDLIIIFKF